MSDSEDDIFVIPTLAGKRFAGARVPVDLLGDLAVYKELVLKVAKDLYRQRYGRERVPKGFEAGFQLSLAEIRVGSAGLVLRRETFEAPPPEAPSEDDGDGWDAFEAARDEVDKYVGAIAAGQEPPELQPSVVRLFSSFGKGLRDGEAIRLAPPRTSTRAVVEYTPEVRKKIVLRWADTYDRDVQISGTVEAFDRDKGTFKLQEEAGRSYVLPYRAEDEDALIAALREHAFTRVEIGGTATYDRQDQIKSVQIQQLSLVLAETLDKASAKKIEDRLGEMKALQHGWDNGTGEGIAPETAERVRLILLGLVALHGLPIPFLYPTHEGGIRAEWTFGSWEVSCNFEPLTKRATLEAVNVDTRKLEELTVPLESAEDKDGAIAAFVEQFKAAA